MIRRPPRSTLDRSSAASDVYKRQGLLLSKVIGMFDINDDVTAYMNGNPTLNPNAFASGVENFGQQGLETTKAVIRHDGSSKFTDTEITGKIESNSDGNKIVINPSTRSLSMTNADNQHVLNMSFESNQGYSYSSINLYSFDGNTTVFRNTIDAIGIRMTSYASPQNIMGNISPGNLHIGFNLSLIHIS